MPRISPVALIWVEELKKRGIKKFRFGELPDDLKIMEALKKAHNYNLIEKLKLEDDKNRKNSFLWRLK